MSEINPAYFIRENLDQCKDIFDAQGSITLQDFFDETFYKELQSILEKTEFTLEKHPIEHRYEKANIPQQLAQILSSEKFATLMKVLTGDGCHGVKGHAMRFTWKDYTILDDRAQQDPGFDIIIDCNDEWNPEDGGSVVYVNGTGDYSQIAPSRNTLTLVKRESEDQKFIHYLNHHSRGKARVLVIGTLF